MAVVMLGKLFDKARKGFSDRHAIAREMTGRANEARDGGRFAEAAALYSEALRLRPGRTGIIIQCAHMHKEAGDHERAEHYYLEASRMAPGDADLALQIGHFFRCDGRIGLAEAAYLRAGKLAPDWAEPAKAIKSLADAGWVPHDAGGRTASGGPKSADAGGAISFEGSSPVDLALAGSAPGIVGELLRRPPQELLRGHPESIELRRLGRRERTPWGLQTTLRGVEALRGFCISAEPISEVQIHLNGQLIHRGPVRGGYILDREGENPNLRKYVFNVWFDFGGFAEGQYDLDFRCVTVKKRSQVCGERVAVVAPFEVDGYADSDGLISMPIDSARPLEEQINRTPSFVRRGKRSLFAKDVKTILVQRADQLGDLVVSVPAIRRVRSLFPQARLIGLISLANRDLARSLELFDETIVIEFPEDRWERRRVLSYEMQNKLRDDLTKYSIDVAIDLSENVWSRYLLLLTGARLLVGFRSPDVPLDIDIEGNTHDRVDNHEIVPHTNKQLGLIEWFGAMARQEPNLVVRDDIAQVTVNGVRFERGDGFVVMHDGARLQFSRWPYYLQLAEMILAKTDLSVVMLTDDRDLRERLPESLRAASRFVLCDERLDFEVFDGLVTLCTAFVGNDSGPKHLASLRGAKVVSIHMARNNWNEWGQENGGYIISRKVPCAGCIIHYEPEECAKDFVCMTAITTDEVYGALDRLIREGGHPDTGSGQD